MCSLAKLFDFLISRSRIHFYGNFSQLQTVHDQSFQSFLCNIHSSLRPRSATHIRPTFEFRKYLEVQKHGTVQTVLPNKQIHFQIYAHTV